MRTALGVKFPDHQGKYREFSRLRGRETDLAAEKASHLLWFLSKFPTQQIREFQNVIRELFCGIREFTGDNRDNHTIFVYSPSALWCKRELKW